MKFELGNRPFSTVSKLFLAAALAVVIALVQVSAFSSTAEAAGPVATVNSCDSAIASMNKTLTLIAKRRIALRAAKKSGVKKVKRAKRALKKAQKQGNAVRAAIKQHCGNSTGVSAQDAQCTLSINTLSKSIELAYTRKLALKKIKVKGKKAKKKKRTMKTQLKKLNAKVAADTANFQKACGNSGTPGGTPGGGSGTPGDTTPPGTVTIVGPGDPTNDNTPTLEIASPADETGGHIECKIDGGSYATVTSPWTLPALADGTHTITCRYVDAAGNAGPETTITITVDTTAPGAVTIDGPNGATNDNTPTYAIDGGGEPVTYQCSIDGAPYAAVPAAFTTPTLLDGAHVVACRAVDAAGNPGPASTVNPSIDTLGPVITIADGLPKWDGTHSFTLSANEPVVSYKCSVDGGTYGSVAASFVTSILTTGTHSVSCKGTDAAGNTGDATTRPFGVFKNPAAVSKSGGFQWGLACTKSTFLNALLGCPEPTLSIAIPANPNGLTGSYMVDLAGVVNNATAALGIGSKYTLHVVVDGASVASDSEIVPLDICGLFAADLSASKTNLSLASASAHTITLSLKTSALIAVFPSVSSSSLSVSIH